MATGTVTSVEETPFGTMYAVDGALETPDGRNPWIRSAWFVDTGGEVPRLASAYPTRRRL